MSFCTAPPVSLEAILYDRSTDYFRQFTAFVHSTFCTENLAFWLAVQQYNDLCHKHIGYHVGADCSSSASLLKSERCFCASHDNNDKQSTMRLLLLAPSAADPLGPYHCRTTTMTTGSAPAAGTTAAATTTTNTAAAAAAVATPAYVGEIQEACHAILRSHIRPNSPQEINIPCEMRQQILHRVEKDGNYHPAIFIPATESVLELMRANSFVPWCSSITASAPSSPLLPSPLSYEEQQQQRRGGIEPASQQDSLLRRWWVRHQRRFGSSSRRSSRSDGDLYFTPARPCLSAPSTPRSSGESFRNWSPWRKLHLHR